MLAACAVAFLALGALRSAPAFVACGVLLFGAEYATFLRSRSEVDRWAPLVAAALFLVVELGYRAVERDGGQPEGAVRRRDVATVLAAALASVGLGGLLLAAAGGADAGLGLEAVGAVSAVLVIGTVVGLVARSRDQAQLEP